MQRSYTAWGRYGGIVNLKPALFVLLGAKRIIKNGLNKNTGKKNRLSAAVEYKGKKNLLSPPKKKETFAGKPLFLAFPEPDVFFCDLDGVVVLIYVRDALFLHFCNSVMVVYNPFEFVVNIFFAGSDVYHRS